MRNDERLPRTYVSRLKSHVSFLGERIWPRSRRPVGQTGGAGAGPQVLPSPAVRPSESGLVSWLTTIDHKRIAILYGVSALASPAPWRVRGDDHPPPVGPAGERPRLPGALQPALHDARHDHDLPRDHAAVRRLLQPGHPLAGRRARRRLPPPERLLLLDLPGRRRSSSTSPGSPTPLRTRGGMATPPSPPISPCRAPTSRPSPSPATSTSGPWAFRSSVSPRWPARSTSS